MQELIMLTLNFIVIRKPDDFPFIQR